MDFRLEFHLALDTILELIVQQYVPYWSTTNFPIFHSWAILGVPLFVTRMD